jgi:hypothetical protein
MGNGGSAGNKNGSLKETLGDHEESINCMALSEDGSMLVSIVTGNTTRRVGSVQLTSSLM